MKLILPIITIILCGAAQQKSIDKDKIVGVWKIEKHTFMDKEEKRQCEYHIHFPVLQLSKDSSYSIKIKGKITEMGKWRWKEPDLIMFYNCKDLASSPLPEHRSRVIAVKSNELRLEEHQCHSKIQGETVYERVK